MHPQPSRRQRGALLIELRIQKLMACQPQHGARMPTCSSPPSSYRTTARCSVRRLVGSAGNAPVRHFRLCFVTPDLQSGSRITSLGGPTQVVGSGSGSHTHLKKFMRLLSVHWSSFPQLKLVESVGNAPTSTCLQSRCIACLPRPRNENGRLPPCCPE